MARRQHLSLIVVLGFFACFTLFYLFSGPSDSTLSVPRVPGDVSPVTQHNAHAGPGNQKTTAEDASRIDVGSIPDSILSGGSIAPKLENATIKAELGRASWKLFHTMMARFPEKPTEDDSLALKTYIQLFARLYPCGDCAVHFRGLLAKYPPQTGSRNAAAGWACFMHNLVNERLHKPEFDCTKIGDFYDCGCGEEGHKEGEVEGEKKEEDEEPDKAELQ
ncbi:FAD-linked sulfhydryl oxidase ALR [Scedosporium apiospermum]|uniref:Sulfhydryl oxidase n=1 Tax=Pseudallescheria apiosperma TaxID=563466 RepID=A0A084GG97_PSEDA|nr:FAD-linked sulfhydryl oxidase ALR [Scedosporium apiospermum]KEZ46359.1 FAD-linked sulfhydryl oxidase ALR [Scedosporium apiospermum]